MYLTGYSMRCLVGGMYNNTNRGVGCVYCYVYRYHNADDARCNGQNERLVSNKHPHSKHHRRDQITECDIADGLVCPTEHHDPKSNAITEHNHDNRHHYYRHIDYHHDTGPQSGFGEWSGLRRG